uniref:HAT C-terminal dimerisation domain-containing protein n=1 Tax=Romanomermis culicivorax TaxID=13658 RepID=A0A915KIT1_ROMCU
MEINSDQSMISPNKSDVSSPYQIQGFNDHNSNYSTYEFLDSLNEFVESQEINEFKVQCLRNDYDWSATLWHCLQFHDIFRNLSVLSEITLCFNATNAGVERGFSL